MGDRSYIAVDLGAGSGRVILGNFSGSELDLREVHRFENGPMDLAGTLRWDIHRLFAEIKIGIGKAVMSSGGEVRGIGVDAWGVDYGLLDSDGALLSQPFNYRDSRTETMIEAAFERVPRAKIFEATGIQFMTLNSLFQLLSAVIDKTQPLGRASTLLFIPDLINYFLTGERANERTVASTSQCYNPQTRDWAREMLDALGIPVEKFAPLVDPGTTLGLLRSDVAEVTGAGDVPVLAVGSHDTASAVAAVPASGGEFAYLSSGTWSLLGLETQAPVINEQALDLNFTNEVGVCDTIRLLKNINGLWILQETRRIWAEGGREMTYGEMMSEAAKAKPFTAVVDVDHADFMGPGDMEARIRARAEESGQPSPETRGEVLRSIFESLALKYRWVLERADDLQGRDSDVLHIVGGGTQNRLLNQFAANAVRRPVVVGPVEATAAGNVISQMMATGDLASLEEGRALVRNSFETETYEPADPEAWDDAYERLADLNVGC